MERIKSEPKSARKSGGAYWRWSKLFLRTLRALSYMPFEEINDEGDLQITFRSWMWTMCTAAIQTTIVYLCHIYRVHSPQFWENYVKVLENIFRFVISSTVPQLVASWSSTQLMIDYVKEWRSFEENYTMFIGQYTISFKPWIINSYLFLFGMLILSLTMLDQYLFDINFNLWLLLPYFLAAFYTACLCSYWIFHCFVMVQTVKELRRHLIKTLSCCPEAKTVRCHRILWLRLQHLATQLPVVFSAPLITQLLVYFITYVFDAYALFSSVSHFDFERIFGFFSPFMWCVIVLVSLNESSYYLGSQVSAITLLKVLKIRTLSLSLDSQVELDLLTDSIMKSPNLELSDCVSLGRTFLIDVARTSLTYLIVLTQFDSNATTAVARFNIT